MSIGAFGLSAQALVCIALLQASVQGILVALLLMFLASESNRPTWFKLYVILANTLTAGQTVIHIIQAYESIDLLPARTELVLVVPVLTGLISASVQPFFMYRCWRTYQRRFVLIVPLLLLWMIALICAILMGVYLSLSPPRPPGGIIPKVATLNELWSFSSLAFDLITTLSTIIYLVHLRKELTAKKNVLVVVWQVVWGSALPPLLLVSIAIVDGHLIPGSSRVVGIIAVSMMGKIFVLSLMINLVGQGHIRRQFEQRRTTCSPPGGICYETGTIGIFQSDWPSVPVHVTVHAETVELTTIREPGFSTLKPEDLMKDNPTKSLSDETSLKQTEIGPHAVHNVWLSDNQWM